jgi:glutaconate CoA-transferase subunit A
MEELTMPLPASFLQALNGSPPGTPPEDVDLERLGEIVSDGSLILFGGSVLSSKPMSATRELIRKGAKGLGIVAGGGGIETDLLIRAGCVDRLIYGYVSLGTFGVAPALRRAIREDTIRAKMFTGHSIGRGLEAAARGLSYLPCHTDFDAPRIRALAEEGELCRFETCPFTGSETYLVRAIRPDFGIIHADGVDEFGNVVMGTSVGDALLTAMASKTSIVTYEHKISGQAEPSDRLISRTFIDFTAHAPSGAWPTSFSPRYQLDPGWFIKYIDRDGESDPIELIEAMDESAYLANQAEGLQ